MTSYSPNLALAPQAGDMPIITVGQSNDMFWGPLAQTSTMASCFFLNPRSDPSPANWTLNEGRDSLWTHASEAPGYVIPGVAEAGMPVLNAGEHRGGSPWSRYMNFFASTSPAQRFAGRLIIAQCGDHSMPSGQFKTGTTIHNRVINAWNWFTSRGWSPKVLWVAQGESDALGFASKATYKTNWQDAFAGWRTAGITCPIVMDQNTLARLDPSGLPAGPNFNVFGTDWNSRIQRIKGEQTIREAQRELWSPPDDIYMGVDADLIHDRYDGCHHSTDSQTLLAYWRYVRTFELVSAGVIVV